MDKPVGSWFAQMVNKIQDSGKFRPETRLPFVQISSISISIFQLSRMALKKWNTKFYLERSVRKNRTTFSDDPLLSDIMFHSNDSKTSCSIDFSSRIFRTIFMNGK